MPACRKAENQNTQTDQKDCRSSQSTLEHNITITFIWKRKISPLPSALIVGV